MSRPSLDDYVDVAERIALFKEQYPDGSLQGQWGEREVDGQTFVVYKAFAYRTPQDPRPGQGWAWEPFPGTTPYTKNSELMNAETAAWGRAIVALGIGAKRSVASAQEVKARSGEQLLDTAESVQADREAAPRIPGDRAFSILHLAQKAGLAEGNKLKPVFIAKLVDVSGQQKVGNLNVDQAEQVEAWISKEAA